MASKIGNFKVTLNSTRSSSTSSSATVLSQFEAFLPKPITDKDLKSLDPQLLAIEGSLVNLSMEQDMLFLVYEELWVHNRAVVHLHALLAPLLAFHKDAISFSKMLGKALNAFGKNKIPSQWACYFPKPLGECQSLVSAVKILKLRLDMYVAILKAGSVPQSVHPVLFSNPDGVISKLVNYYAMSCQVERSSVVVQAEVIHMQASYSALF